MYSQAQHHKDGTTWPPYSLHCAPYLLLHCLLLLPHALVCVVAFPLPSMVLTPVTCPVVDCCCFLLIIPIVLLALCGGVPCLLTLLTETEEQTIVPNLSLQNRVSL